MRLRSISAILGFILAFGWAQNSYGFSTTQVNNDLWDVSQGTIVTSTSGYANDPLNVFGKSFGVPNPPDSYFVDGKPAGFSHFIEFKTVNPVTVRSLNVWGGDDRVIGAFGQRAFNEFRLFGWNGTSFVKLIDNPITVPYAQQSPFGGDGALTVSQVIPGGFTSDTWRAEFVQPPAFNGTLYGPRVLEMDAFPDVPEPGIGLVTLGALALIGRRSRRA